MIKKLKLQLEKMLPAEEQSSSEVSHSEEELASLNSTLSGGAMIAKAITPAAAKTTSAYSHGFESIYSIETVDVKSIRKMGSAAAQEELKKNAPASVAAPTQSIPEEAQLPLLSEGMQEETMESFRLHEPIQVLRLPQQAQQKLFESGKRSLRDLWEIEMNGMAGLGQGHIDELREKLRAYFAGRDPHRMRAVDFTSLVRCLVGELEPQKAWLFLEAYQLEHLVALSPAESTATRHLNATQKSEFQAVVQQSITQQAKSQFIETQLGLVAYSYLTPWMRRRFRVATRVELEDRLEVIAEDPTHLHAILEMLSKLYFDGQFLFKKWLKQVEADIYCVDDELAANFRGIVRRAKSYFYRPGLYYSLREIVSFLERECAVEWQGYPEGFVEKVLLLSSSFSSHQEMPGKRIIRLR